jgi:hypothetical protein
MTLEQAYCILARFRPRQKNYKPTNEKGGQKTISHYYPFKGIVARYSSFVHSILSRDKERFLNFFHFMPIFSELWQDLTHLAQYAE